MNKTARSCRFFNLGLVLLGPGYALAAGPLPDAGQMLESIKPLPERQAQDVSPLPPELELPLRKAPAAAATPRTKEVSRPLPPPADESGPLRLQRDTRLSLPGAPVENLPAAAEKPDASELRNPPPRPLAAQPGPQAGKKGKPQAAAREKPVRQFVIDADEGLRLRGAAGLTPPVAPEVKIPVKGFKLVDNKSIPEQELLPLLKPAVGKALTLAELNALVAQVSAYYRRKGYLIARAYLPAQDIDQGIVRVAVIEGRLSAAAIQNNSAIRTPVLQAYVERLKDESPLHRDKLEEALLLLGDLPGIEVRSTLRPGSTPGTSELGLQVEAGSRISGAIDTDNFGSKYTGAQRLGLSLDFNSPSGRGDLLQLRGLTSGQGMSYGRVAWQTPLGGEGLRLGVAMSDMQYSLGKDFQVLNASGSAQVNSLWLSLPMLRSTSQNHYAQLSYDRKRLEDRVELTATQGEKTLDVLSTGLSGHLQDSWLRGGQTNYSANFVTGRLGLQDNPNAGIYATSGTYQKLTFALSRLQQLGDSTALYASLSGQMAGKNLDSSEKFSLGGAYGVRAFPQGELSADDAWLTSVELRWTMSYLPNLQLLGFVESGTARINHSPLASDSSNTRTLSGEGLGLRWGKRGDLAVQGYLAWRSSGQTSSTSTETDRSPRLWLQAAKYF